MQTPPLALSIGVLPTRGVSRTQIAFLAVAALAASLVVVSPPLHPVPAVSSAGAEERVVEGYGDLPISFEPNVGQAPGRYDFVARGQGFGMTIDATGATLTLGAKAQDLVRMDLLGASRSADSRALESLPGTVNYFLGNDPSKWRSGVPTFERVSYGNVLPGIDITYYGTNDGTLEYDFVVAPGADPSDIRVRFSGANDVALRGGSLVIKTDSGAVTQEAPVLYQTIGGRRVPVEGSFSLAGDEVGFVVGAYDHNHPLVIDPTLIYSTYLGGSASETAYGIEVDATGAAYVVGRSSSLDFPTTPGAFDTIPASSDLFVTKLNAAGSALVYSTYIGGSAIDQGFDIAVDGAEEAYVTGTTFSSDFPTTAGAFDVTFNGGTTDGFITKLNAAGSALVYSTYLGGGGGDGIEGIAVDGTGAAYVTGSTNTTGFPTTLGAVDTIFQGSSEAIVTKLNAAGSALTYSTYLGGSDTDSGSDVAVDGTGAAYVTGSTSSSDFPTTPGAFDTTSNGSNDPFVTKLDTSGQTLTYSTYLGGTGRDEGEGVVVDGTGAAYVIGATPSGFPTTPGAFDTTFNGGGADAFVTKLDVSGQTLTYSTYLGGSDYEWGYDIALDGSAAYVIGTIDVAGVTSDFPTTPGTFDSTFNGGGADAFVTKLDPAGSALTYSTYLGGSDYDEGFGIAVDASGATYVTGDAYSVDFPTTPGAFDTTSNGGGADVFVTKLAETFALTVTKAGTGSGTVTSTPAGISCGLDCTESYTSGTSVTLTATADPGSSFTGWSGACSGTCTLTMDAAKAVTATFNPIPPPPPPQRTLTVTKTGSGLGTVTSALAGIDCGADCTEAYSDGTTVTLTATPASGSTFGSWSGCGTTSANQCTVTMSADRTVTASFLAPRTLTVTKTGSGLGTVTSAPAGIDCGADCSEAYIDGTAVTLTASPDADSTFGSWSGCDSAADRQCTVTMSADRIVTVSFATRDTCAGHTVTIQAIANQTTLGTTGDDVIKGTTGIDTIDGLGGNDIICGLRGNDKLHGDAGDDILHGNVGNDKLYGDAGDDKLFGGIGNFGGPGDDELYGGDGQDRLFGDGGDDRLYGGDGNDILFGNGDNDKLYGGDGNDHLYGKAGSDTIYGGDGSDTIYGNAGSDTIYGGDGNDYLNGGNGGANNDYCDGGAPPTGDTGTLCEFSTNIP